MNYREAVKYITNIQTELGSDLSLKEVKELCRMDENPDQKLRIIHIAGTNGKGSVGNYICNILAMAGYTVGRYVSPTLFEYRERIQKVTGNMYGLQHEYISEQEVADCVTGLKDKIDNMMQNGYKQPTAFEIETVMAFETMAKWKVDVAVIEVGMGGRLDATNIITKPVLSVLTSIGMDHMSYLGDNIQSIAREKYGIIKNNVPVVSILQQEECMEELKKICMRCGSHLSIVSNDDIRPYEFSMNKTSFIYQNEKYTLAQAGIFQLENAALAIEAANVLYEHGFRMINLQSTREALQLSKWPGRFECVSHNPYVLVDGAHNPMAAKLLRYSLDAYFPGEKFNYIIGVFKDKDYRQILKTTLPHAKRVYTVKAPGERGLSSEELAACVEDISQGKIKDVQSKETVSAALSALISNQISGKVVVFGSLSFLHEVYEYFGKSH